MGQRTPLFEVHRSAGARIVDFGGWEMPLHYGSQVDEHHAVRRDAGLFDVSHMNVVDVIGRDACAYLRVLLANDVGRLQATGKALYSCMLNDDGGVLDDLIVYYLAADRYRVVLNAATRDKDLAWLANRAERYDVDLNPLTDIGLVAIQGPQARERAASVLPGDLQDAALQLPPFAAVDAGDWFVARTGYTGEDGFEIMVPAARATGLWQDLVAAGASPAGLGARDTLRLEAGMHLYGSDLDEDVSPLESGLGWTVAFEPTDRDFVGRAALERQVAAGGLRRFAGLLLEDRGVLRNHQRVVVGAKADGEITSGGFSPTLGRSIAMARLPGGDETAAKVEIRGKLLDVRIVPLPFVRHGAARINI